MRELLTSLESPYGPGIFFLWGMITSLHCICMCGPISMIVFQAATKKKNSLLLYHGSRILSYTWIGWTIGILQIQLPVTQLQKFIMYIIGFLLFIFVISQTSSIKKTIYKLQAKLMRKAQPLSPNYKSIMLGFFTPLLPCGPLYAAIGACIMAPTAFESDVWMFLFACGTIPLLFLQQTGIARLAKKLQPLQAPSFYRWISILVIGFLAWMYVYP